MLPNKHYFCFKAQEKFDERGVGGRKGEESTGEGREGQGKGLEGREGKGRRGQGRGVKGREGEGSNSSTIKDGICPAPQSP